MPAPPRIILIVAVAQASGLQLRVHQHFDFLYVPLLQELIIQLQVFSLDNSLARWVQLCYLLGILLNFPYEAQK